MRYMTFDGQEHESYETAILLPRLDDAKIRKHIIDPHGLDPSKVIAFTVELTKKKTPVTDMKAYLATLLPVLKDLNVKYVLCCESGYFQTLARVQKTEANLGYAMTAEADIARQLEYRPFVFYCPNPDQIFYDPEKVEAKITQAVTSYKNHKEMNYIPPGENIIHFEEYPDTEEEIQAWLDKLLAKDTDLACDIEGFSLKHYDAGIGTIGFAWNQHEGIAFPVDYRAISHDGGSGEYGEFVLNPRVKKMLVAFFKAFKRKLIFHNISYDATVLIYQLFMKDICDTKGLLDGMDVMLKNWHDTKLIAYLATNSCAGNKLSLKDQAQEFAGNYAQTEIKNIRLIPKHTLLRYNLIDCLSTWYVFNKHYQTMLDEQQEDIYLNLFQPAILDIVQMQLTGLPVNRNQVTKARAILEKDEADALDRMLNLPLIKAFEQNRLHSYVEKKNAEWKKKRATADEIIAAAVDSETIRKAITFNPNSDPQLRTLLYEQLGLPEIDFTDSKLPSTGGDTLKKLVHHTTDPDVIQFLKALKDYKDVNIILTIFIPAFERSVEGPDGWHYLFGNFNLGGTVSGRLSSNDPNLQNIPATGSKYAKVIKECIQAPKGKLFVGLDFASLEDRISALTTKDPNKLKVYTDGYDGHSLRAFFYFKEQMVDLQAKIEEVQKPGKIYKVTIGDDVEYRHESNISLGSNYPMEEISAIDAEVDLINSISKTFKDLRQESKAPTFALTYQGTFATLMANCGFSEEKAKMIEARYHEMYVVSDEWVQDRLQEATRQGFITAAFGLRVRTPLLHQVILGNRRTPREAQAEGRTAGNALGQSWCLLNSRAGSEFMGRVRKSPYRLKIRPCAQIHDAQYYLIDDDTDIFLFLNKYLVMAAQWQNHPDIWHDEVKLGGEASIFFPNWAHEMTVPNDISESDLRVLIQKHLSKLKEKGVL